MHMVDFLTGAEPEEERPRPIQSSNSFEMEAKISKIDLTFNDLKVLIFCSTVFFLRMLGTWKKFQTFHKQEWQLYLIVPDLDRICNKYLQLSLF